MSHYPILQTKLYIPPIRSGLVPRPRLIERLNEGLSRKLALVSAPAGFGKTTLVSEWLAGCSQLEPEVRPAWLSLDEGDSDPTRFLTYLVAALQRVAENTGAAVLKTLQSPQPPPTESVLAMLLNEITALPDNFALVLDDYHVVDAKPVDVSTSVDQAVTFLLEHLPPQMHLVIATREDPQLPLARYRAQGQLIELRVDDLRFTPVEAAEFLNQVMGLGLSAEDVAALEARTEGWIAGLQLAAISMQGRKDTATRIESFTGSHRFVLDYLVEEVLQQQSESIQTFLLQTTVLDRLNGSLCDAILGRGAEDQRSTRDRDTFAPHLPSPSASGQEILEHLERSNLFVVPLDEERRWYRYHHLFADLLGQRLHQAQPRQLPGLHGRASEWYEQNGFVDEAIEHALRAEDYERAADLLRRRWPTWWRGCRDCSGRTERLRPAEVGSVRGSGSEHTVGRLRQNSASAK